MAKLNKTIHNFKSTIGNHPKRSAFPSIHEHKTSFNAGELIPIYIKETYPGDEFKVNINAIIRQTTMLRPVMDNANIDLTAFFVPNRLVQKDWAKVLGENDNEYIPETETLIPWIEAPAGGWEKGTIADYMGIVPKKSTQISALMFRTYCKIWNDYYRDQNLQKALHIDTGNADKFGTNGKNPIEDCQLGGYPAKANKRHDYFTSCLPTAQKGEPVTIGLAGDAPILTKTEKYTPTDIPISIANETDGKNAYHPLAVKGGIDGHGGTIQIDMPSSTAAAGEDIKINNLWANLEKATGITVNNLRMSIATQHILELDARGGTRYIEYIKSHFGVTSGDARLQRAEFLGGKSIPLNVIQVAQTSAGNENNPLADLGAFGQTGFSRNLFSKAFTEHGWVIILATIRYNHTYQQGVHKSFKRKSKLDLYDPILANIGEQPVYNYEIYNSGDKAKDNEIFGFQEPWAELRYDPSRTSGEMRSNGEKGQLDIYHYGDYYTNEKPPKLSADWIEEDKTNIDRTLALTSDTNHQFWADFRISNFSKRPLPTYSIPGLHKI